MATFLAHAGEDVDFAGRSTDPGSDDLDLSWDWGDGPPVPDVTTTYLVNPPDPDPFPSPSIQPRDITDMKTHAFADACLYIVGFDALDDDGGTAADSTYVLIVGNADEVRSTGYWKHQMKQKGKTHFDPDELLCYLAIVNYVSLVFDEAKTAQHLAAGVQCAQGQCPQHEEGVGQAVARGAAQLRQRCGRVGPTHRH